MGILTDTSELNLKLIMPERILEEFDSLIINKFSDNSMNAQNTADIALEKNSYDVIHSNSNISTERRSTYSLIYQGRTGTFGYAFRTASTPAPHSSAPQR